MEDTEINTITEQIIGCAYQVHKVLGCGFLEKVYENALAHEMKRKGLKVEQQVTIDVYYDDIVAGTYQADIMVEEKVLIELKALEDLNTVHIAQCLNYLKAMGKKVCLLLNFGKTRLQIKRISM